MVANHSTAVPAGQPPRRRRNRLAAQVLLDLVALRDVALRDSEQAVVRITVDDAFGLQSRNPKGKLLEWCAKNRLPPPQFEQGASAAGYRVRGLLRLTAEHALTTAWFDASKLKLSEQGASEALLQQLPQASLEQAQPLAVTTPAPQEATPQQASGCNASMALNELCQVGVLQAVGYDVLDQAGPSHQPTFAIVAWAATSAGDLLHAEPVHAPSKKAGQRQAADRLLDLLVAKGLTRR